MNRIRLADVGTAALIGCAVVVAALLVRRELYQPPPPAAFFSAAIGGEALAEEGHLFGPPDARVRIVEFSDFECPFCARVKKDLRVVREQFPADVAIVYRHFPLEGTHRYARAAAQAAECAGEQGRFEVYHDALYADQHAIGLRSWLTYAEISEVPDLERFAACVAGGRFMERIDRDLQAGRSAGVQATPTFVVGGRMFSGTLSEEEWARLVREELAREQDGSDTRSPRNF